MTTFSEILDATKALSLEDQAILLHILQRRIAERNREELIRDIAEARGEFAAGRAEAKSVTQLMDEVDGEA